MPLPTLNLIGPGRLGRTLARLWHRHGLLKITGIQARQTSTVQTALTEIGAGEDCAGAHLPASDFLLIATPDNIMATVVQGLLQGPALQPGCVVFHASGALGSDILAPLREQGALIASVHPLKSFVPGNTDTDLAGTWCACEGDAAALLKLAPLFDALGAHRFSIDPQHKTLYHAGAVLACNDLVALMEAALRCMSAAGVDRNIAWPALRPLINGTLDNLDRLSTTAALTGPVARGDHATVARQLTATQALDPAVADAYRALAALALQLAKLEPEQARSLGQLLETHHG
ncbi:Rossmann-like and DUF2520 domain-containing protein [Chitinimonas naiadis]